MTIECKPEFFDIVSMLTQINEKIIVDVDKGRTIIRRQNDDKNIAYILSAPHNYFGIDTSIGFFKFSEFYKFLLADLGQKEARELNSLLGQQGEIRPYHLKCQI